jgi:hypothetical protein
MKNKDSFKLPTAFLSQLEEFTNGFYLVSINDQGHFETHFNFPTPVAGMAILNFLEIESEALQENVRKNTIESMLSVEDNEV